MADIFGTEQDLGVNKLIQDCSWETPLFLPGRPLTGEELSLLGRLADHQDKKLTNNLVRSSGFFNIGDIIQQEGQSLDTAKPGDVITSEAFPANTFYLASGPQGYWVNIAGNLVNLSGTGTDNIHNLISLPPQTYSKSNLVFLEVWRGTVGYGNVVKRYGNQGTLQSIPNDLLDTSLGIETARRVQIQYRLRVAPVNTSVHDFLDAFSPAIKADAMASSATTKKFSEVVGNPGLFRAGGGEVDVLGTVDGYSYAIPLFLVYRREQGDFIPRNSLSWGKAPEKEEGRVSLHPSRKFSDRIYATDIVDLRHIVSLGNESLEGLAERTFDGLLTGHLATTRGRIVVGESGLVGEGSGGSLLVKADNLTSMVDIPSGPRGSYMPGRNVQYNNVWKIEVSDWVNTSSDYTASLDLSFLNGTNYSLVGSAGQNLYIMNEQGVESSYYNMEILGDTLCVLIEAVPAGTVYLKYDIAWDAPDTEKGFLDVPEEVLQQDFYVETEERHINAVVGNAVLLQGRHPEDPNFYNINDKIEQMTEVVTNSMEFGQIATLYRSTDNDDAIYDIELDENNCLPGTGQKVIGLRSIRLGLISGGFASEYINQGDFRINENEHVLTVDVSTYSSIPTEETKGIAEITLYLGTKFSNCSREARGLQETFETYHIPVTAIEGAANTYLGDTKDFEYQGHVPAIANLCKRLTGDIQAPTEIPYILKLEGGAWKSNTVTVNDSFPYMDIETRGALPSQVKLTTSSAITGDLRIGVHVYSWYKPSENLVVTYNTRGYQGIMLDSEKEGDILVKGPAIITTRGSYRELQEGFSFKQATIASSTATNPYTFTLTQNIPDGCVLPGDILSVSGADSDSTLKWRTLLVAGNPVVTVTNISNSTLEVTFKYPLSSDILGASNIDGSFIRPGSSQEGYFNPLGRMPMLARDDFMFDGADSLKGFENLLKTSPHNIFSNFQSVTVGSASAYRGRSNVQLLPLLGVSPLDTTKKEWFLKYPDLLGETALPPYKVVQSFVFKEKGTGRLYLGILSSSYSSGNAVASTCPYSGQDAVDLFELIGRPVLGGENV